MNSAMISYVKSFLVSQLWSYNILRSSEFMNEFIIRILQEFINDFIIMNSRAWILIGIQTYDDINSVISKYFSSWWIHNFIYKFIIWIHVWFMIWIDVWFQENEFICYISYPMNWDIWVHVSEEYSEMIYEFRRPQRSRCHILSKHIVQAAGVGMTTLRVAKVKTAAQARQCRPRWMWELNGLTQLHAQECSAYVWWPLLPFLWQIRTAALHSNETAALSGHGKLQQRPSWASAERSIQTSENSDHPPDPGPGANRSGLPCLRGTLWLERTLCQPVPGMMILWSLLSLHLLGVRHIQKSMKSKVMCLIVYSVIQNNIELTHVTLVS